MTEGFDPYLQWLGIRDPQRPPNHYRLLGIELFESDPDVISNAADRQMAHVRTFQAGRRSAESQRVLNELAGAKVCLLTPTKKGSYDTQLRAELGSAGPAASVPVSGPILPPAIPVPFSPPASKKLAVVWVALSASVAVGVVLVALLVFMFGGTGANHEGDDLTRAEPFRGAVPPDSRPIAEPGASEDPKSSGAPKRESAAGKAPKGEPAKSPGGEATAKNAGSPAPKVEPVSKGATNDVRPPPPVPGMAPGAAPESPKPPAPEPKSMPKPPVEPLPSFEASVQAARAAMTDRDPAAARNHVQLAEKAAYPADQKRLERLHDVLDPWEAFWTAVRAGMAKAKPGDVLRVDDQTMDVVQGGEESLTVRTDGAETKYTIHDLPAGLALALADRELPENLASVPKAAFLAIDPAGDPRKGMELCRRSGTRPSPGLNAELRQAMASKRPPPEPVPPAPSPPSRLPIPEPAAQQAALKEVRDVHKARFAQAKTPPEKGLLASDLLAEAKETKDNAVARYVLMAEARDLAVAAGEPSRLRDVVLEMAKGYQVDALQEQARVLAEASESPMPSAVRTPLAKAAIDLASDAIQADAYAAAAQLAKAGFALASRVSVGKGRDLNTIRQANELRDVIPRYKEQYELALQAEKALAQDSNNAKARLFLGRYYTLVKDNWNRGLPLLMKSDDTALKPLAEAEQAATRSPTPAAMVELGDQWVQAAASMEDLFQRCARRRALHWYEAALPRVTGLTKERVTQAVDGLRQNDLPRRKP